jgi:hypothetical protein
VEAPAVVGASIFFTLPVNLESDWDPTKGNKTERNPGLKLANAFSVMHFLKAFSKWVAFALVQTT